MTISIEGKIGSGKSLFSDWLLRSSGIVSVECYSQKCRENISSYRSVVVPFPTYRTVRYICNKSRFNPLIFSVKKLVFRHGKYINNHTFYFYLNVKTGRFIHVESSLMFFLRSIKNKLIFFIKKPS